MSNQKDQIEQTNLPIRRPRKIPNSQWAEMRTAFAAGIGLRELARQLGIPAGTVLARAKRENWSGHIKQATTLVPIERQSETMSVAQAVTQTVDSVTSNAWRTWPKR